MNRSALRRRLRATAAVWQRGDGHLRLLQPPAPPAGPLPQAAFDTPARGRTIARDLVRVEGWAIGPAGIPDRVELTLDGAPAGRARLCLPRPDLPGHVGPYGAIAGFEQMVDLTVLPPQARTATLGGTAVYRDGSSHPLPAHQLAVAPPAGPDAPAPRLAALRARCAAVVAAARTATAPAQADGERPLRLLVVTHHLGFGGAQLVLAELLERWAADGVSGAVVAPADGATRPQLERAGWTVHVAGPMPLDDAEAYEGRTAELAAWAAPQGFDAVLVNTACAFTGGDLAARLGLPAVWIVHESYGLAGFFSTYGEGGLHPHVRARGEEAFAGAAAIVFEVDATRRLFEADAGPAPLLTIPYGIDVDALDRWADDWDRARARAVLGLPQDATVVMCVGTIEPRKAQAQLVEAFARVAPATPGATLVLVGDRGDGGARAPRDAVVLNWVKDQVRILPVLPDVRPCYLAADVLVCASDVESLPRTVLEAMALRVPVVATDVFGLPEVVRDGETGWLCQARDTAALAAALERALATPPAGRAAFAEAARSLVRAEHAVATCAPRYAAVVAAAARGAAIVPEPAAAGGR